jgi:ZIP family zinc transporter
MYKVVIFLNYLLLAFLSTLGTWFLTLLGSSTVFFFKKVNNSILNMMLGFSSGIMIAASFFSLLQPAVEMSENTPWLTVTVGFLLGGITVLLFDILLNLSKMHTSKGTKRCAMLISSITLHNIPEGLVVGVAFGALKNAELTINNLMLPLSVAIGIGLQNFPEGAAVSIPLRREGYSRSKSFFMGQLSGMVEPVFGVLGALLIGFFTALLPYALAFAAGAMITVVVKELIPEAESDGGYLASLGTISGFSCMMLLDVALG